MAGFINRALEGKQFKHEVQEGDVDIEPVARSEKSFYQRVWPVFACGAGLFSDGYINGVSRPSALFLTSNDC